MNFIGLDIGTTSVSGVIVDSSSGELLASSTHEHHAALSSHHDWERTQDPERIVAIALEVIRSFIDQSPDIAGIGVTGQMHGILYYNEQGQAVSPNYTWQDGRGNLPTKDNQTYVEVLSKQSGYVLATGFGTITHAVNQHLGCVPGDSVGICGMVDYVVMRLGGLKRAVSDVTQAASMGCFDLRNLCFDEAAINRMDLDPTWFPEVSKVPCEVGRHSNGIPVFPGIGDNQASYLGSVRNLSGSILINIGTGSQISIFSPNHEVVPGLDLRPFFSGGYLLVGAPLCGGKAYALLKDFYADVLEMSGAEAQDRLFEIMNQVADSALKQEMETPTVDPRFLGTRTKPGVLGSISNISMENFTPARLAAAFLKGMAGELHDYLDLIPDEITNRLHTLVGSGNAIRLNPVMQNVLSQTFGLPLHIPAHREEASVGAALLAAIGVRALDGIDAVGPLIEYL